MDKRLIHDYWEENNLSTYPDFTVDIQCVSGGVVIFRECDKSGFEYMQITIEILDILAWVYAKMLNGGCIGKI